MIECSDVAKFDSISGSHVVGRDYTNYNRKIPVCGLPDTDRQRYIDKFKSLGIDKCRYEILRVNGRMIQLLDKMASTIESY